MSSRRPPIHVTALGFIATVVAALALQAWTGGPAGASAPAASVVGDDERDAYVGTGGLILPGGVPEDTRASVAGCPDCAWRVTSPCVESDLGNSFDGAPTCLSVTRGCQVGSLRRTWFRPAGQPWRDLGLMCMTDRPRTVERTGNALADRLAEALPPLRIDHRPERGVVTTLPTLFDSGHSGGSFLREWTLGGARVTVEAQAQWTWSFAGFEVAGRPLATHVFRTAGPTLVSCEARWTGSFTVAGLGPFPIPESVVQRDSREVWVGEGRALLTPR